MDIEHNLQVGLLALRAGSISANQCGDAWKSWAKGEADSIGDVLIKRGHVSSDRWLQLEAEASSRSNGSLLGDPVPETPSGSPTVVDPYATLDPSSLIPRTGPTLRNGPEGSSPAFVPALDRRGGDRYTQLDLYGEGGLGQVWRAHDRDLNREVALKELRPSCGLDHEKVTRFLFEAQVTGQLEHPNIVPVHELAARCHDGKPYYTMRLVRGKTFTRVIQEYHESCKAGTSGRLELACMLGRFYAICFAVGYAHSRGVIHLDLKPDNVMLGDYGEVYVLDWGLARLVPRAPDSDESSIHLSEEVAPPGSGPTGVEGTPAYMAPEQVDPSFGPVGTGTDIYGLGSILFQILTGQAPHRGGSLIGILGAIVREPTPLARSVEPSVPPVLQAICAKAMAKDPAGRYTRAGDLVAELQRYMNDEPTSVYREPIPERVARWLRRHRTWTQAAAVALILVSVVSTVAAVLVVGARRAEEVAHREAEGRYLQARSFADTLLAAVSEDLKDVPGAEGVRRRLLEKAAEAYQSFASEPSTDPGLRLKSGQAFLLLAEIRSLIGDVPGALTSCQVAEDLFGSLARADPGEVAASRWHADALACRGRVLNIERSNDRAEAAYRRAMSEFDALMAKAPHDRKTLDRRASCALGLALVLQELNKGPEAERTYLEAIADYDHIIRDSETPETRGGPSAFRNNRARGLANLATLLDERGRPGEAEDRCRAAIADLETLLQTNPEVPEYLNTLAASLNNLGILLKDRGQLPEAEVAFNEAVNRYETLVYKKTIPKHVHGLVNSRMNLADRRAASSPNAAEATFRAAVYDSEILARLNPGNADYLQSLGESWHALGTFLNGGKHWAEAADALGRSVEIWRQLIGDPARSGAAPSMIARKLSASLFQRSLALLMLDRIDQAIVNLKEFSGMFPDDASDQYNAACCWSIARGRTTDSARRREYGEQGRDRLRVALTLKPSNAGAAASDADLAPLREVEGVRDLIDRTK